jgi:hypothetical protein
MTFLSPSELAQLRSDLTDLLPDTCRIERATITKSGAYDVETWGTAVASVACRVDPDNLRQNEDIVGEREAGITRYIVTVPYNTDVQDGDRLVHGGNTYEITMLHDNHSARMARRLRVSQIRGE